MIKASLNLTGLYLNQNMITKYLFDFKSQEVETTVQRLTNQTWKLIPMRENEENWQEQLNTVILEVAGLNEIFSGTQFLQLLSKLEGLKVQDTDFRFYRKSIFECISILQGLRNDFQKQLY